MKDITKVDKRCVSSTDNKENDDEFIDYLVKAKENMATKLKEVSLSPRAYRSYTVEDITIPEGTQVITFGNDACDRRGGGYYEAYFCYEDESEDYEEIIGANSERNRFMIIPKANKSSLIMMDYVVGYDGLDNIYTESECIVKTFKK